MLRIVSQAIPPDNREATYQRFVIEARVALEHAVAATVSADASFAERERAILLAANEACRLALAATLQATAAAHPDQCGWMACDTSGITKARSSITVCEARSRSVARRIAKCRSGTGPPWSRSSSRRA